MQLDKKPHETGPMGKYLGLKHLSIRARFLTIRLSIFLVKASMKSEVCSFLPVLPLIYGKSLADTPVPDSCKVLVQRLAQADQFD